MKRLVFMLTVVLSCALSLTLAKQADAYTFTTLNVPGATYTYANGINDAGNVIGGYSDGTGDHSYTYDGSTYSTLNVPGASVRCMGHQRYRERCWKLLGRHMGSTWLYL